MTEIDPGGVIPGDPPPDPGALPPTPVDDPDLPGWDTQTDAAQATADQAAAAAAAVRTAPRIADHPPAVEDGDGFPVDAGWHEYDPATNLLVQTWRWDGAAWQALDMSAGMIPVLDIGSATVGDLTGGRINVQDGPIVAGDPAGARVELTGDGLHAYDATGAETARIQGTEGVFVGGEFRTSDDLPGQVSIRDDGYVDVHGAAYPGIRIIPTVSYHPERPPGIGVNENGLIVSGGGSMATGGRSFFAAEPDLVSMRSRDYVERDSQLYANRSGSYMYSKVESVGTSRAQTTTEEAALIRWDRWDLPIAYLRVTASEAAMWFQESTTLQRALRITNDGVWVETTRSGTTERWNLTGDDWSAVTLGSEWSPRSSGGYYGGLRVRRLGGSVEINGAIQGGSSGSKIGTIVDPKLRPKYDTFVVTTLAAGGFGQAFVGSNGDIIHSYGPSAPAFLAINVSIPLN